MVIRGISCPELVSHVSSINHKKPPLQILGIYVIANLQTIMRITNYDKDFDPRCPSIMLRMYPFFEEANISKLYEVEYIGLWIHQQCHSSQSASKWILNDRETHAHIYFVWRIKDQRILRDVTNMFRKYDNSSIHCALLIRQMNPHNSSNEVSFFEDDSYFHSPWLLRSHHPNAYSLRSNNYNSSDGLGIGYYLLHNRQYGNLHEEEDRMLQRRLMSVDILTTYVAPFVHYTELRLLDCFDVMAGQIALQKYHGHSKLFDLSTLQDDVITIFVPFNMSHSNKVLDASYHDLYIAIEEESLKQYVTLELFNNNNNHNKPVSSVYDPPLLFGGTNVYVFAKYIVPFRLERGGQLQKDITISFSVNKSQKWIIPSVSSRLRELKCSLYQGKFYSNYTHLNPRTILHTPLWFDPRKNQRKVTW